MSAHIRYLLRYEWSGGFEARGGLQIVASGSFGTFERG